MSILELMTSRPFLAEPDAFRAAIAVASRGIDGGTIQALAARKADKPGGTRHTGMREGGVAVISCFGPIFRHSNLITEMCDDGTTTARLSTDLQAALSDPACTSIVLEFDSPGGEATGIGELAAAIHAATKTKPVVAYVGGAACSAAYYLASACTEIVVDPMARLGSIGSVIGYRDESARDERLGVRTIEIVSSQSPNKRLDPSSDEGRAAVQVLLDDLTSVFVADVAKYRGVPESLVLSDFGQGGTFVGRKAIAFGLADRTGSLESVIRELSTGAYQRPHRSKPSSAGRPAAASVSLILTPARESRQMNMAELQAAWEAAGKPDNFDLAALVPKPADKPAEPVKAAVADLEIGTLLKAADDPRFAAMQAQLAAMSVQVVTSQAKETLASLHDYVLPAQRPTLLSSLIQAAADDQARPLESGSRVENLRASLAAGPKHNLTADRLGRDGIVLEHKSAETDGTSPAEIDKLLAKTDAGRAVLAARGK